MEMERPGWDGGGGHGRAARGFLAVGSAGINVADFVPRGRGYLPLTFRLRPII
jgi:hypothetical protein